MDLRTDDTPLVYENYKEPLKAIPASRGYGYYGTIATTTDHQLLQCHVCGKLFAGLAYHIRHVHKMTADQYKAKFQLSKTTALVNDEIRERMQRRTVKLYDGTLPAHLIEYNRKVRAGEIVHRTTDGRKPSLEWRNQRGLCPDQVLEKIKELAVELGHTPSHDEFQRKWRGKYLGSIKYQYGTYLNAVKKAKLVSAKELKEPSDEYLLKQLRDFHKKYGHIPMKSDFQRGLLPSRQMYWRRFGTLNNARIEAGLNAVLPMPFGQVVELTPDEYREYKATRNLDGRRVAMPSKRATMLA